MAQLGSTDLHVNITWDTEPTEKAKSFSCVTDTAWLKEIVQEEVRKALQAEIEARHERT